MHSIHSLHVASCHTGIHSHRYTWRAWCCVISGWTNINRHCIFGPMSYKGICRYALYVSSRIIQGYAHTGMSALYVRFCVMYGCSHVGMKCRLKTLLPYPSFSFAQPFPLSGSPCFPKPFCFYLYVIHRWF